MGMMHNNVSKHILHLTLIMVCLSSCISTQIKYQTKSSVWIKPGDNILIIQNDPEINRDYLRKRFYEKMDPLKIQVNVILLEDFPYDCLFCEDQSPFQNSCLSYIRQKYHPNIIMSIDFLDYFTKETSYEKL